VEEARAEVREQIRRGADWIKLFPTGGFSFTPTGQDEYEVTYPLPVLQALITRTDENTIHYEFTIDDPTAFTRVWKGEVPLTKAPGPLYEYACHEGNYAMENILKGARAQEKNAAEAEKKEFR
jgi:hypothetical protein